MTKIFLLPIVIFLIFIFVHFIFKYFKKFKKNFSTFLIVIISLWLVISVIVYPKDSVLAAKNGLLTWFNVVLPALLPFFIGSEILVGLGVVNFIGALLEPLMVPIFNVPGVGAFPFAMSITSGYPVGTKLVSKLRRDNSISKTEGQRLVAFCSTSGPLFMIGAVSVGMFNNVKIGSLIAISHYLSAISVGVIFRFYKRKEKACDLNIKHKTNFFKNAIAELFESRKRDGRNLGVLMGDAVKDAMNTMFVVGGFIILYSVIIRILDITHILDVFSYLISALIPLNIDESLLKASLSGIIEMTNGCKLISQTEGVALITKVSLVSLLIGWSGFSIHSQSMTMIGKTDISGKIYMISKGLHGILASIYSLLLYAFIFKGHITTSSNPMYPIKEYDYIGNFFSNFIFSLELGTTILITISILGVIIGLLSKSSIKK